MKVTIPTLDEIVKKNIPFYFISLTKKGKLIEFTDNYDAILRKGRPGSFINLNLLGKTINLQYSQNRSYYLYRDRYRIYSGLFTKLFNCPHDLDIPIMIAGRHLTTSSGGIIKVGCVKIHKEKQHEIFKFLANHLGYELLD